MIKAVIFDKDGTLFDFKMSWGGWTRTLLAELRPVTEGDLAGALGFDPDTLSFAPDSPVIASTSAEIAVVMLPYLRDVTYYTLMDIMSRIGTEAVMSPAVPLREVLGDLKARGLILGLATNDTEDPARAHLTGAGVIDLFDFVAGCDSGYGGKPAPGQLLAFAAQTGLPAGQIAMVGDSLHDLDAARRAGMKAVGVLTGPALRETLTPHADVVLATIAELGDWMDGLTPA